MTVLWFCPNPRSNGRRGLTWRPEVAEVPPNLPTATKGSERFRTALKHDRSTTWLTRSPPVQRCLKVPHLVELVDPVEPLSAPDAQGHQLRLELGDPSAELLKSGARPGLETRSGRGSTTHRGRSLAFPLKKALNRGAYLAKKHQGIPNCSIANIWLKPCFLSQCRNELF